MDSVKVVHDAEGQTLTVWFGDPHAEVSASENEDGIIVMKDANGTIVGVEILGYTGRPRSVTLEWPELAAVPGR